MSNIKFKIFNIKSFGVLTKILKNKIKIKIRNNKSPFY